MGLLDALHEDLAVVDEQGASAVLSKESAQTLTTCL